MLEFTHPAGAVIARGGGAGGTRQQPEAGEVARFEPEIPFSGIRPDSGVHRGYAPRERRRRVAFHWQRRRDLKDLVTVVSRAVH
ncbi:MAG: hypothetical protein ACREF3_10560, partial [Acetobacteraceae bacterium]